jgi:hypothetical protein
MSDERKLASEAESHDSFSMCWGRGGRKVFRVDHCEAEARQSSRSRSASIRLRRFFKSPEGSIHLTANPDKYRALRENPQF